jgi:hypothetical protein
VGNTERHLIDLLHGWFGGNVCIKRKQRPGHKLYYVWEVQSREAVAVLRSVLPYLTIKARRAQLAIDFQTTIGPRFRPVPEPVKRQREAMILEMRAMNKRGVA